MEPNPNPVMLAQADKPVPVERVAKAEVPVLRDRPVQAVMPERQDLQVMVDLQDPRE
jgi:hypothetical protein